MLLLVESFLSELVKLGELDHESARRSLDRLDALENAKPTTGQVARYGALGAAAGAGTKAIGHLLEHGHMPTGRAALAAGVTGAIGMGAVPLVRNSLDRRAEKGTLRKFVSEYDAQPKTAVDNGAGFGVSQFSGPLSMGAFRMASGAPGFSAPGLGSTFQRRGGPLMAPKIAAMLQEGLSPKGMLASGQRIGEAKLTTPAGPSIADLSKPLGFGGKLPGATKGTI